LLLLLLMFALPGPLLLLILVIICAQPLHVVVLVAQPSILRLRRIAAGLGLLALGIPAGETAQQAKGSK
jgi:hypothetical protein